MKKNYILGFGFLLALFFVGCIREEALNMEADINGVSLPEFENLLEKAPEITDDKVTISLTETPKSLSFSLSFTLSEGATISPENGTLRDFSSPQTYVVTSQDGKWQKTYLVEVLFPRSVPNPSPKPSPSPSPNTGKTLLFSFENAELKATYNIFYEEEAGRKNYIWSSGNEGFNTLAKGKPATNFPTYSNPAGYSGKGVTLITRSTGGLGKLFGAPLAAGSIFLGAFHNTTNPVKATRFGIAYPFKTAPKSVSGYFKYKAGAKFSKNKATSLSKDAWDIYAILFEKSAKDNYLLGDHNFRDSRMVSLARLKDADRKEASDWAKFEIFFENINGKSFDPNKEYFYTIVATSSVEGAIFNGAEGSTLDIDEIKLEVK